MAWSDKARKAAAAARKVKSKVGKPKVGKFGRSGSAAEQLRKYGKATENSVANRRAALIRRGW